MSFNVIIYVKICWRQTQLFRCLKSFSYLHLIVLLLNISYNSYFLSLHPNIQNWNKIVFVQNKWWSFRISEFTKIIQSKESPRNVENWKLKRFQRMAFRTIFQNLSFCSEINFQSISCHVLQTLTKHLWRRCYLSELLLWMKHIIFWINTECCEIGVSSSFIMM